MEKKYYFLTIERELTEGDKFTFNNVTDLHPLDYHKENIRYYLGQYIKNEAIIFVMEITEEKYLEHKKYFQENVYS